MVALSLIELFLVIFFLLFLVIFLYVVCRRFCSSLSPATGIKLSLPGNRNSSIGNILTTNNGNDSSGSSPVESGTGTQNLSRSREARNSIPAIARRQNNIQTIYVGTTNEFLVGNNNQGGSRSVYTIPVRSGTGDGRRASIIVLHNRRIPTGTAGAPNIRIIQIQNPVPEQTVPEEVLNELPPSYEECIEIDSDEECPRYLPPPPYSPFPSYNIV